MDVQIETPKYITFKLSSAFRKFRLNVLPFHSENNNKAINNGEIISEDADWLKFNLSYY